MAGFVRIDSAGIGAIVAGTQGPGLTAGPAAARRRRRGGYTARVALGDLLGNPTAVARLGSALDTGQLGHALLVTGPDQVGKTTLMLNLAAELLPRGAWPGDPSQPP